MARADDSHAKDVGLELEQEIVRRSAAVNAKLAQCDAGILSGMRSGEEARMFPFLHVFAVGLQDAGIGPSL